MNRKLFLAALVAAMVVVFIIHSIDFPGSVPNFEKESGGGRLLDVKPAFSEDAIYERLAGYGERGRENYEFRNLTVDILLPLSVFPFLFLLMRHAIRRLRLGATPRNLLLALPFVYVIFDFAENGTVLALLARYPDRLEFAAAVLPFVTMIKRAASMLAIFGPLVMLAILRLRGVPETTLSRG
jgi:hypothetical protein